MKSFGLQIPYYVFVLSEQNTVWVDATVRATLGFHDVVARACSLCVRAQLGEIDMLRA
jgi:hypothetical protein